MLTPNDIKNKKLIIKAKTDITSGSFKAILDRRMIMELYEEVLKEIAKGSVDPKSLAIAVLKD